MKIRYKMSYKTGNIIPFLIKFLIEIIFFFILIMDVTLKFYGFKTCSLRQRP